MSSKKRIKKVKEYFKNGPPQFVVLARRPKNAVVKVEVVSSLQAGVFSTESETAFSDTIIPAEDEGLIKIVQRLSDDAVIHHGDHVSIKGDSHGYVIIDFMEDCVHCVLIDTAASLNKESFKKTVPINVISVIVEDEEKFS